VKNFRLYFVMPVLYPVAIIFALLIWAYDVIASFVLSLIEVQRELAEAHKAWVYHWREIENPGIHLAERVNMMMPTNQREESLMPKPPKSWRCRVGLHHWDDDMLDENGKQRCTHCGRFYSAKLYYAIWAAIIAIAAVVSTAAWWLL